MWFDRVCARNILGLLQPSLAYSYICTVYECGSTVFAFEVTSGFYSLRLPIHTFLLFMNVGRP